MLTFGYILVGLLGGILAGMGLGGGTLLIPLLNIIFGIMQKQAQFLNISSFLIMSFFVIFLFIKNKMIDLFQVLFCSFFGVISAVISANLLKDIPSDILKKIFGILLICLALFQFLSLILKTKSNKN